MVRRTGIALLLAAALLGCSRGEGPAPVAWDRVRCAQCSMLVGEPAFAAQLHEPGGDVLHFDDPGCLLVALDALERAGGPAAPVLWFHHHARDAWLRGEEVAFVEAAHTPMGYGLGAVASGEAPGALSLGEARAAADRRDLGRGTP